MVNFKPMTPHRLDENLVLFREGGDRFHILNPMARWIWEAHTSGMGFYEIRDCLVEAHNIPPNQAIRDVHAVFDGLKRDSLLPSSQTLFPVDRKDLPQKKDVKVLPHLTLLSSTNYCLTGCEIRIDVYDALLTPLFKPLFKHLEVGDGSTPNHRIAIYKKDGSYFLIVNDSEIECRRDPAAIVVALYWQLGELAFKDADWLMAIHGGAVEKKGVSLILSGASGSGKSTLVAALAASGYRSLGDEGVLVSQYKYQLMSIPLPICIKEGSWPTVRSYYPTFDSNRVFPRHGQKVRFLTSRQSNFVNGAHFLSNLLVFVKYAEGSDTHLRRLSATDILKGLIEADCLFGNPLNSEQVLKQLNWISQLESYQLIYGNMDEAIMSVGQLMDLQAKKSR